MKKRILSGINTSGGLHIGNYLGAIKNWVSIQEESEEIYLFLADLHAITVDQDPTKLRQNIIDIAISYLASGINPEKTTIFAQSQVYTHAELAWIFSCVARIGWLNRMTQFKDKTGKNKDQAYLGLYSYPVLMAADILLYRPTHVPVGDDQKQHIELTRDIAQSFNSKYSTDIFNLPEPLIMGAATRVMSLRDGSKKMSKSDISEASRINLDDDADTIRQKIMRAKSDSDVISSENLELRPELNNMLNIYAAFANEEKLTVAQKFEGQGFSSLKTALSEIIIEHMSPIRQKMIDYRKNEDYILSILAKGKNKALSDTIPFVNDVKKIMGFL
ncbi:MAG: tryptophan--tRNA ligase [Alphaproteobacteria bacterium 33-17]|nr:MAG: tryptophan--tRNA ligase [Alphaproteobacteria bacterium 33-17]